MRPMRSIIYIIIALQLLFACPAMAKIRSADKGTQAVELVDGALERMHEMGIGIPKELPSDHIIYLLIRQEVKRVRVIAVARPSVDPKLLAGSLEKSLKGTKLEDKIVWTLRRPRYSAAFVFWAGRPSFAFNPSNNLKIGHIAAGMKAEGYNSYIALRTATYSQSSLSMPSKVKETGRWYNLTCIGQSDNVTVRPSPTPKEKRNILEGILIIPIFSLFAFIFGSTRARNNATSIERRLRVYHRMSLWPPIMLTTGLALFTHYKLASHYAWMLAENWLGSTILITPLVVLLGLVSGLIIIGTSIARQRSLLGPAEGDPPVKEITPAERGLTVRSKFWAFCAALLAVFLLMVVSIGINPFLKVSWAFVLVFYATYLGAVKFMTSKVARLPDRLLERYQEDEEA